MVPPHPMGVQPLGNLMLYEGNIKRDKCLQGLGTFRFLLSSRTQGEGEVRHPPPCVYVSNIEDVLYSWAVRVR